MGLVLSVLLSMRFPIISVLVTLMLVILAVYVFFVFNLKPISLFESLIPELIGMTALLVFSIYVNKYKHWKSLKKLCKLTGFIKKPD